MYAGFYSQENSLSDKEKLARLLKTHFPINNTQTGDLCWLYPFSNENEFSKVISSLKGIDPMATSKIKVAILFGESNFLSILPEVALHADMIIMADVEFRMHRHNQYLLDCMNLSNNTTEYKENYTEKNNPLIGEPFYQYGPTCKATKEILNMHFTQAASWKSLGNFHFLDNEIRFAECKEALKKISHVCINLDLTNKEQCASLANLLHSNNATITLCNFTNIHDYPAYAMSHKFYPEPSGRYLHESTLALLFNSPVYLIMYATTKKLNRPDTMRDDGLMTTYVCEPTTHLSLGLNNYQNNALTNQHYKGDVPASSVQFAEEVDTNYPNGHIGKGI